MLGGIEIFVDKAIYSGYEELTSNQSKEIGRNLFASKPDENCVEAFFPSTTSVTFCENKQMLSVVISLAESYRGTTKGLLGTWNDDPNDDFTLPDGTVLPPSLTAREIHFGFGVKCE